MKYIKNGQYVLICQHWIVVSSTTCPPFLLVSLLATAMKSMYICVENHLKFCEAIMKLQFPKTKIIESEF